MLTASYRHAHRQPRTPQKPAENVLLPADRQAMRLSRAKAASGSKLTSLDKRAQVW
jgi:hypothetical protein